MDGTVRKRLRFRLLDGGHLEVTLSAPAEAWCYLNRTGFECSLSRETSNQVRTEHYRREIRERDRRLIAAQSARRQRRLGGARLDRVVDPQAGRGGLSRLRSSDDLDGRPPHQARLLLPRLLP